MPNWDEEKMAEAIELVNSGGKSISDVSKWYGIPRTTLSYRLKESNVLGVGRPTVFTAAEERIIANVVRVSQDRFSEDTFRMF